MSKSGITNNKSLIIYAIMGSIAISAFLFLDVFKRYTKGDWFVWDMWGGEPMIETLNGWNPFYISSTLFCVLGIVSFIVGCFMAKGHPQSLWKWTIISVLCIFVYIFIIDGNTYERSFGSGSTHQYVMQLCYDSLGFILYVITSTIWLITSFILSRKQK